MQQNNSWWPLSEVSEAERDRILALTPSAREKAINRLKADIKSGAHARRLRHEATERRGLDG